MTAPLWVSIVLAVLSFAGMIVVMMGNGKVTLQRSNIQNATDIANQYKQLNSDLNLEIQKNELNQRSIAQQFKDMEQKIRDMQKAFKKRETFLESEVETRDVRISVLELENKELLVENSHLHASLDSQQLHGL